ncbi:UNVERIFIED_CONTAM: Glycosyltransferase family 92 protein RCOM [Sesamum latifolium]|uniref:Glycosyltransferase family 92 protein n=1 Tax=Sesamum latifolium TaxID=2727402 RepID=A0AAW2X2Y5_9LAMI
MDSSDQRRKRKRILRQSYSPHHFLSVRSLVMCFSFFTSLCLLSYTTPFRSSAYRPVQVVSSLSLLSSSISRKVKSVQDFDGSLLPLKIEGRVLFPDHVLLLVGGGKMEKSGAEELECVYYGKFDSIDKGDFDKKNVFSVDEYDGFRSIVSRTVNSWENVAYEATLDGDTAIVFVKGLNLRPDRESDPSQFSCHFGLGKWGRSGRFMLPTKALTAAQEVVRCSLPKSISRNPDKAQGIRVTVGATPHARSRAHKRVLVPSVAKIFDSGPVGKKRSLGGIYELCVCTMVWNQAPAIREWIKYHSWLGVERWFIYDNNSDDGLDEVIQELDLENYNVTRHVWPWIKTQEAGFSHCAVRAKDECNWVSFMDVDEYFYFPYSTPGHQNFRALGYASQNSLRALVANFSSSSSTIGEIRTSCHSFGPSGLNSPPPQGVTVGYTCRLQSPERHKSIIRPDALDTTLLNVVHHFHLRKGFEYLNLPQKNQNEGVDRAPGLGTEAIEPPDWPQKFCEIWDTGLRDFVLTNLADPSTGLLPWARHSALGDQSGDN